MRRSTPLLLLALTLGCGGAGTPNPATPSPTASAAPSVSEPSPTPAPTATPLPALDEWQVLTSLQVAPEGVGFDYNGDGLPDNGIYAAVDVIAFRLAVFLSDAYWAACEADPPTIPESACISGWPTHPSIWDAVEDAINVDNLNSLLAATFATGARPFGVHLERPAGDPGRLSWHSGQADSPRVWDPEKTLGILSGRSLPSSSEALYGPGDLVLWGGAEFQCVMEPCPEGIDIPLEEVLTQLTWQAEGVQEGLAGGLISIQTLVDMTLYLLIPMLESSSLPLPEDLDEEELIGELIGDLIDEADATCASSGDPCFSGAMVWDGAPTTVEP